LGNDKTEDEHKIQDNAKSGKTPMLALRLRRCSHGVFPAHR